MTDELARILRENAADLRQVNDRRDLRTEADRLDHIADWLGTVDGLPEARAEWPCALCEAGPNQECFEGEPDRFHFGRGFQAAGWSPTGEVHTEHCGAAILSGPGRSYRPSCSGCDHKGPIVDSESLAVELSHDHSFPGWRNLPTVPRKPNLDGGGHSKADKAAMAKWLAIVNSVYGEGWLEKGGPILTHRPGYPAGTRHVPAGNGLGTGYDLCASVDDDALVLGAIEGLHLRDFLPGCDQRAARKLCMDRPGSWGRADSKGLHRSDRDSLSWDRFFAIIASGYTEARKTRYDDAYAAWNAYCAADREFSDHKDPDKALAHRQRHVEVSNELRRTTRAIVHAGAERTAETDVGDTFTLF